MKAVMYHYVRPNDSNFPHFKNLDINNFKLQLEYFEKNYGFVSKSDFLKSIKTGIPSKGVVLTFDDGLSCHFNYVFKELKKRQLWGVFYVPTYPLTKKKLLDVHRIHLLLGKYNSGTLLEFLRGITNDSMIDESKIVEFKKETYQTQLNDEETLLFKRYLNYYISYPFRNEILNKLMINFFSNEKKLFENFYLTKSQIQEMYISNMIIGSHTVNHKVMSRLEYDVQKTEIKNSFDYIENNIKINNFKTYCHPYGGNHSFNEDTISILKKNKCLFSFGVENRDISQNDLKNNIHNLPRYDCNFFKYGKVTDYK